MKQFTDHNMAEEPAFYQEIRNWQPGVRGSRPARREKAKAH
ncbi:hypothetical protein [Mucilaginibacter limnophilus]|nr:hypothetical protein [Mucilaginibacter limnophilus]